MAQSQALVNSLSADVALKLGLGFPGLSIDSLPPSSKVLGAPKKVRLSKREISAQRSKAKKKNQDGWDEIIKSMKAYARELSVAPAAVSELSHLFDDWTAVSGSLKSAAEKPFPPPALIIQNTMDANTVALMMKTITCKATAEYAAPFITKRYKGIKSLQFWGAAIGDDGCRPVAAACALLSQCNKLELLDCNLTGGAAIHLSACLKQRQTAFLRILRLDNNPNFGAEGVRVLAAALQFNSNLKLLSLANCGLLADAGDPLARILQIPQIGLETLNLEGNLLSNDGLSRLSRGLAGNSTLTTLNLKMNQISSPVALEDLLRSLDTAPKLRRLNLDGNLIGDDGMRVLVRVAAQGEGPACWMRRLEECVVSPFCNKELFTQFSAKMDEYALQYKKPKKKKARRPPSRATAPGSGSVFASPSSASRGASSSSSVYGQTRKTASASSNTHYSAAITSLATSAVKK